MITHTHAHKLKSPPWIWLHFGREYYFKFCRYCHGPILSTDPKYVKEANGFHQVCKEEYERDGYIQKIRYSDWVPTRRVKLLVRPLAEIDGSELFLQLSTLL